MVDKEEEGTFQQIDEKDETVIGPEALLVCGFSTDLEAPLVELLGEVEAKNHRVLFCSPEMVKLPLGQALETEEQPEPAAPDKLPRVVVLSGLKGGQIQRFLNLYRDRKLPRPIFASTTPANLSFPVGKLVVELLKEQRMMARRR